MTNEIKKRISFILSFHQPIERIRLVFFMEKITTNNLEIFYLIWLGNLVNPEFQQQLRTIINHLSIFEQEEICLQYIHSLNVDERVIFIVKGKLGQQIVPQIVHLPQIHSIYVYSNDKKGNEQWTKNYKKIRGVFLRREELLRRIQTERDCYHFDQLLSYKIFNAKTLQSIHSNNPCLSSQLLIDCLIHTPGFSSDKHELLALCKEQYGNNSDEFEEFQKDYSSDRSLWWLTRQAFLSRWLFKAMKMENIRLLLFLRFFMADVKQQLERTRISSSIRVYRAQLLRKEEVDSWMKSIGDFLSIDSFFITSFNREQTRSILSSASLPDETEKVFIEINANYRMDKNNLFSNISSVSSHPERGDIVFAMGSIFRLIHIDRDIDGIWNVQMNLCASKDHQLQIALEEKREQLGIVHGDRLSFGFLLEDMKKFDQAEQYYRYVLKHIPKDHEDVTRCYHALGELMQNKGDYDGSIKWYEQSLAIDRQMSREDDPHMAIGYNSLAAAYSRTGDYTLALEIYEKSLKILRNALGEDHLDTSMCYNNMGIIYHEQGNHPHALHYFHLAWNIRRKHLSIEHPTIAQSHACIGNAHYHLAQYDLALEHYHLALVIFGKELPANDQNIGLILRNIGLVYQKKEEYEQARSYLEKALIIYRQLFPSTHSEVIQIEQLIQRFSST